MNNGKPSPPEDQAVLLEICNILKRHEELLFHSMVETQSLVFILKEYLVKFDERLEAKNVEIAVELKPAYDILLHSLDAIIARLHS